jgi:ATP-binding cassette, subfamily B, bacterial
VFLAYLKNAYKPARDFAKYTTRLARASAAGERILDILDRAPDVRDRPGAMSAPSFRGSVRFEHVTFGYEPGRPVLHDIDLAVQPGRRIAIVGGSGSGKSTLASLLLRLYDPWQGRVLIDGSDVRGFTLESLRAQVAIVLQDPWLFALSVRENLACAAPGADHTRIEEAARLANAHEFITAMPNGYDTIIGERGVTLSNGERQRLALARAALRPAPILILDEPTTGLDAENAAAVMTAIDRLARRRTTFLITHDLRLAARAELVLCLDGGRIIERGTPADLLGSGGRYAALFMHQMTGGRPRWLEGFDARAR